MIAHEYKFRADGPGPVFGFDASCGAMSITALTGKGTEKIRGSAATVNVLSESAAVEEMELGKEDFVYFPAGSLETMRYKADGLILLTLYAPVSEEPDPARGPIIVPRGRANGYVRTQYRGSDHGTEEGYASFNPDGITYVDKVWGCSRDVLSQELTMPPGAIVPCHVHDVLGLPPNRDKVWQAYYVWEGSARVDIGNSRDSISTIEMEGGDVILYPNGVAHNVVAGDDGCRYIFLEKKALGDDGGLNLDQEREYEHRLTCRLDMNLAAFIRQEKAEA